MSYGFTRALASVKVGDLKRNLITAYVKWDPKGASEAEMLMREKNLDAIGLSLAQARQAFNSESARLDAALEAANTKVHAAESLERKMNAATDPAQKKSLEASMQTLMDEIQEETPDLDTAKAERADAETTMKELEGIYNEAVASFKQARTDLKHAQSEMASAQRRAESTKQQAETAAAMAGLRTQHSTISVALDAMHETANTLNAEADANRMKVQALAPKPAAETDPNIAAALAEAKGEAKPAKSVSERLQALKARVAA